MASFVARSCIKTGRAFHCRLAVRNPGANQLTDKGRLRSGLSFGADRLAELATRMDRAGQESVAPINVVHVHLLVR